MSSPATPPTARQKRRQPTAASCGALVEERTGFKRAHIYSLMKEKKFPQRVRLGVRAVGWYEDEIDQWLADRERA